MVRTVVIKKVTNLRRKEKDSKNNIEKLGNQTIKKKKRKMINTE